MRPGRYRRSMPLFLGALTLACVAVLLGWDAFPSFFPPGSHALLAALSLAMIAVAYLLFQIAQRPPAREFLKAVLLAVAFLFWAANQFWPDSPRAVLFNDIAIALFVLDVFLVIVGWPRASRETDSFTESGSRKCAQCDAAPRAKEHDCSGPASAA